MSTGRTFIPKEESGVSAERKIPGESTSAGMENSLSGNVYSLSRAVPLSGAEQIRLARRAHAGDERARRRLVQTNMRLVFSVAKKYRGEGIAFEDLVSEGVTGLLEGIRRFDPDAGYRLSTYATFWIRHAILDAWLWQDRTIRLSRGVHDDLHTLNRVSEELFAAHGREPTAKELARAGSFSLCRVEELLRVGRRTASLDAPAGRSSGGDEDGRKSSLGELQEDEELGGEPVAEALRGEREAALAAAIENLPEPERYILRARYGLDGTGAATLGELSNELGVSRSRIGQRQKSAEAILGRSLHAHRQMYGRAS